MKEPKNIYEERQQKYLKLNQKQKSLANNLSNYRLASVILGLAITFFFYRTFNSLMATFMGIATIIIFVYLAIRHNEVRSQAKYFELLSDLNRKGIDRLTGEWVNSPDAGEQYKNEEHPYSSDLDLFGKASFFQWISSAQTPDGKEALAKVLKEPLKDSAQIISRQEAVTELASQLPWRQEFEVEGILVADRLKSTAPLYKWAEEKNDVYLQNTLKLGMRFLPCVTSLVLLLYFLLHNIPWQLPVILIVIQILLLRLYGKERSRVLSMVYSHNASLGNYTKMLKNFEEQKFTSEWLTSRQSKLQDDKGQPAHLQIQKLSKIAERISNRENAIFLIVNVLFLWDYQCMFALEEWKKTSGKLLRNWFEVIAEVEALSSIANIRFDNPQWVMPEVLVIEPDKSLQANKGLRSKQMGHPLLTLKRVANDFTMKDPAGIALITGSNMSGKSTFLRTVGSNLVLAYIGAPVCAEQFQCSIMNVWTCMRVSDNLEQSISSFYAEILRIKGIVEAAKTDKPVFFLLDEIFKGTNSHDRHQGAKALINQLQREGALGLVSTHDLELGELEKESKGRVKNYHFREHYENTEIQFDYQLRAGISTTRNAMYLIKLAGIELE